MIPEKNTVDFQNLSRAVVLLEKNAETTKKTLYSTLESNAPWDQVSKVTDRYLESFYLREYYRSCLHCTVFLLALI